MPRRELVTQPVFELIGGEAFISTPGSLASLPANLAGLNGGVDTTAPRLTQFKEFPDFAAAVSMSSIMSMSSAVPPIMADALAGAHPHPLRAAAMLPSPRGDAILELGVPVGKLADGVEARMVVGSQYDAWPDAHADSELVNSFPAPGAEGFPFTGGDALFAKMLLSAHEAEG